MRRAVARRHLTVGGSASWLAAALLLMWGTAAGAQRLILEDEPPPSGIYGTVGAGIVDVVQGTGLDIPIGLTMISPAKRIMVSVTAFDLGLLQGSDRDLRYQRFYSSVYLQEFCVDTTTGQVVSFGRCGGNADLLRSASLDLNVLPVEMLYVGNKAGSLHMGLGLRLEDPRTVYGTLGMFFPSRSGRAVGARLSMGREFIYLGFTWGISAGRFLSYF